LISSRQQKNSPYTQKIFVQGKSKTFEKQACGN
jgi:hypothetical protein